jgi:hypothetical protein
LTKEGSLLNTREESRHMELLDQYRTHPIAIISCMCRWYRVLQSQWSTQSSIFMLLTHNSSAKMSYRTYSSFMLNIIISIKILPPMPSQNLQHHIITIYQCRLKVVKAPLVTGTIMNRMIQLRNN